MFIIFRKYRVEFGGYEIRIVLRKFYNFFFIYSFYVRKYL